MLSTHSPPRRWSRRSRLRRRIATTRLYTPVTSRSGTGSWHTTSVASQIQPTPPTAWTASRHRLLYSSVRRTCHDSRCRRRSARLAGCTADCHTASGQHRMSSALTTPQETFTAGTSQCHPTARVLQSGARHNLANPFIFTFASEMLITIY